MGSLETVLYAEKSSTGYLIFEQGDGKVKLVDSVISHLEGGQVE